MKKVEKVSIAGISFSLDSDAYVSLRAYLDSLDSHYDADPDGGEIIADIEARIAELILDEQVYTKIVSKELIDSIVAQLGSAEEIDDDVATDGAPSWSLGRDEGSGVIQKRLYRSSEHKVFGGVCGGLAEYFNVSVIWPRLVFLLPVILSIVFIPFGWRVWFKFDDFVDNWFGVFLLTYVVLWIAMPIARTPRQKLEARGEKITPSSIRQNLQQRANTPSGKKAASVAAEILTVLGRIVLFFVKFVAACVAFGFLVTAVAIMVVMIVAPFTPWMLHLPSWMDGLNMLSGLGFAELVWFCVMIPLLWLGVELMCFVLGRRRGSGRGFRFATFGLWILAVVWLIVVMVSNASYLREQFRGGNRFEFWEQHWGWGDNRSDHDSEQWRKEVRRIETLPADGVSDSLSTGVSDSLPAGDDSDFDADMRKLEEDMRELERDFTD